MPTVKYWTRYQIPIQYQISSLLIDLHFSHYTVFRHHYSETQANRILKLIKITKLDKEIANLLDETLLSCFSSLFLYLSLLDSHDEYDNLFFFLHLTF